MEAHEWTELTREEIREIVRSLPPIDWERMYYLASLSPAEQILEGMRLAEAERAIVRDEFRNSFPNETNSEINMRVLRHFTTVRMD